MRKEIKRIPINCLGKYYDLNFLKKFKPGQIIYDLVTIVDSETNQLANHFSFNSIQVGA